MLLTDDIPYPRIYAPAGELPNVLASLTRAREIAVLVLRPGACPLAYWPPMTKAIRTVDDRYTEGSYQRSWVAAHYPVTKEVRQQIEEFYKKREALLTPTAKE